MAVKRNYVGSTNPKAGYGGYTGPLLGGPNNNGPFQFTGQGAMTNTASKRGVPARPPTLSKSSNADTASMVASAVALAGGPLPGNFQALLVPKKTAAPAAAKPKAKAKAPVKAIARRVGVAGPVAPPVDPLDTLRGEYDKYLTDMFAGLQTTLKGDQEQYKVRSQELADRLKANYDDAANVAGSATKSTQDELAAFAQRMGLQQATQGQDVAGWEAQNQRLKALNEVNRASSASTNDTIRSNYYDFLGDKVASARGMEATSRATLNDLVAQAKIARQQAQMAAAAAAARARSSRGRGGGSGGSGGASMKSTSTNDVLNAAALGDPKLMAGLIAGDTTASNLFQQAGVQTKNTSKGISSDAGLSIRMHQAALDAEKRARDYMLISGKTGGPKTSSTVKYK